MDTKGRHVICIVLLPVVPYILVYLFRVHFLAEVIISPLPLLLVGHIIYLFLVLLHYRKRLRLPLVPITLNIISILVVAATILSFYQPLDVTQENTQSPFTIVSFNINAKNKRYELISQSLNSTDADIISFYEFRTHQYDEITDVLDSYPYTNYNPSNERKYAVIFSKLPFQLIEERTGYTHVVIEDELGTPYSYYAVHATAPVSPKLFAERNEILSDLKNRILSDDVDRIIVSGDFNLTPWSHYYNLFTRDLPVTNISNGRLRFTWFAYNNPVLALHIDHTFVSAPVVLGSYSLSNNNGSDHLMQIIHIVR